MSVHWGGRENAKPWLSQRMTRKGRKESEVAGEMRGTSNAKIRYRLAAGPRCFHTASSWGEESQIDRAAGSAPASIHRCAGVPGWPAKRMRCRIQGDETPARCVIIRLQINISMASKRALIGLCRVPASGCQHRVSCLPFTPLVIQINVSPCLLAFLSREEDNEASLWTTRWRGPSFPLPSTSSYRPPLFPPLCPPPHSTTAPPPLAGVRSGGGVGRHAYKEICRFGTVIGPRSRARGVFCMTGEAEASPACADRSLRNTLLAAADAPRLLALYSLKHYAMAVSLCQPRSR